MKIITIIITAVGVVGLLLSVATKFIGYRIGHMSPAGYLHGASAMFLLALVIMVFGKHYCSKEGS